MSLSGGDIASIVLCSIFGFVLVVAAAASFDLISLAWLASASSLKVSTRTSSTAERNSVEVSNPMKSRLSSDVENRQSAIVLNQPVGRLSLLDNEIPMGSKQSSVDAGYDIPYQVYRVADDRNLFGIPGLLYGLMFYSALYFHVGLRVRSQVYALVTLSSHVFSVASIFLSYLLSVEPATIMSGSVIVYHVLVSWVAVPIWQKFSIVDSNQRHVDCAGNGCIYCRACGISCQICIACNNKKYLTPRSDKSCRYIPMSLYNLLFMLRHPGKEINNELPENLEEFGFGRGYFLLMSLNARGSLNLYIFLVALTKLRAMDSSINASTMLALLSLCFAALNLKIYFLSLFLGLIFLPYTYLMAFMMCCVDCCGWIGNLKSPKGSWSFKNFLWTWKIVKQY